MFNQLTPQERGELWLKVYEASIFQTDRSEQQIQLAMEVADHAVKIANQTTKIGVMCATEVSSKISAALAKLSRKRG